jgi:hypothetical protein
MSTLTSFFVERGVATMRTVEEAIARQVVHGGDLATNLLELRSVQEEAVTRALAEWYGLEPAPIGMLPSPEPESLRLVPGDLATRHSMCPLHVIQGGLVVAIAEPLSAANEEDLGFALNTRFRQLVAPLARVRQAIATSYGVPFERRLARLVAKLDGAPEPPPLAAPQAPAAPRSGRGATIAARPPVPRHDDAAARGLARLPSSASSAFAHDDAATREVPPRPPSSARSAFVLSGAPTIDMTPRPPSSARNPLAPGGARPRPPSSARNAAAVEVMGSATRVDPRSEHAGVAALGAEPAPAARRAPSPRISAPAAAERLPARAAPAAVVARPVAAAPPPAARRSAVAPATRAGEASPPLLRWLRRVAGSEPAKVRAHPMRHKGPFTAAMAEAELLDARSADAVLDTLLSFAAQFFEYAAVFVVHGDVAQGRDAAGPGASRERVATLAVPLGDPGVLAQARGRHVPLVAALAAEGTDAELVRELDRAGAGPARRTVGVVPIVVRGRAVALLFGDDGATSVDLAPIGDVIALAGLVSAALERLLLLRKTGAAPPPEKPAAPPRPPPATAQKADARAAREALARAILPEAALPSPGAVAPAPAAIAHAPAPPPAAPSPAAPPPGAPLAAAPPEEPDAHAMRDGGSSAPPPDASPFQRASSAPPPDASGSRRAATVRGFGDASAWIAGKPAEQTPEAHATPPAIEAPSVGDRPRPMAHTLPFSVAALGATGVESHALIAPSPLPPGFAADIPVDPSTLTAPRPAIVPREMFDARAPRAPIPVALGRTVRGVGALQGSAEPTPSPPTGSQAFGRATLLHRGGTEIDALLQRLLDDGATGQAAFAELVKRGDQAMPAIIAAFPGPLSVERAHAEGGRPPASQCGPILALVIAIRRPALPFLTVRSASTDAAIRFWATHAFGEMLYTEAATALLPRLFDDDPGVRRVARAAAQAVLGAGAPGLPLVHALERLARDPAEPVARRAEAVHAMGDLKVAGVVQALLAALDDAAPDVRGAARGALVSVTCQDFGPDTDAWSRWWRDNRVHPRAEWLVEALTHPSRELRLRAITELEASAQGLPPFDADAPEEQRRHAQRELRAFWEHEGRDALR